MENILESYLVKLGFAPDISSLHTFQDALKTAEGAVDHYSSGMVKGLLLAQTAVLSTFTTVSAAIVGVVDKMAMADQGFRLAGLHMNMTAESARKLTMITDALGASIEEITWDPELHQRMMVMNADLDKLGHQLGPNFEEDMKRLRDMRAEFGRVGYSLQFLGMQFSKSIFESMGLDFDNAQKKLHGWIDDFQANIPTMGHELATTLLPVLKETWGMFKEIGGAAEGFGLIVTNTIGVLSGDKSIQGSTFSLEKMAKAFEHVVGWASTFFHWITEIETKLVEWGGKTAHFLSESPQQAREDVKAALLHGDAMNQLMTALKSAPKGSALAEAGASIQAWLQPKTPAELAAEESAPGANFRGGDALGGALKKAAGPGLVAGAETRSIRDQIADRARERGIDPNLALSLVNQESHFDPKALSSRGAMGLFQLMPGTAKDMGVTDPNDVQQNINAGIAYLEQQLKDFHGDRALALAAYNAGPDKVHKAGNKIPNISETQQYVAKILAATDAANAPPVNPAATPVAAAAPETPYHIEIHFGDINVNGSGLNEHQTRRAVAGAAQDLLDLQNLHDQVQLSPALH